MCFSEKEKKKEAVKRRVSSEREEKTPQKGRKKGFVVFPECDKM